MDRKEKVIFNLLPRILIKNIILNFANNMSIKCYFHSMVHVCIRHFFNFLFCLSHTYTHNLSHSLLYVSNLFKYIQHEEKEREGGRKEGMIILSIVEAERSRKRTKIVIFSFILLLVRRRNLGDKSGTSFILSTNGVGNWVQFSFNCYKFYMLNLSKHINAFIFKLIFKSSPFFCILSQKNKKKGWNVKKGRKKIRAR